MSETPDMSQWAELEEDTPESAVHKILSQTFRSRKTQSVKYRKEQLMSLRRGLKEMEKDLCEGVKQDLGKSHFDTWLAEIQMVDNSAAHAIEHLQEWSKSEIVQTNMFNFPAQSEIRKDPRGVVFILAAWNYNILLSLQPLVGAIAAGNCALLKPGSWAKGSSAVLAKLIEKYLDPDAYRATLGDRNTTNSFLQCRWDLIFFTGSKSVGAKLAQKAALHMTPCVMELGGKSPCVVDKKADLRVAADRIAWGTGLNAGQVCVRPDYIMVDVQVKDKFLVLLKQAYIKLYGQNPENSENYGRIIDDKSFQRLKACMQDAEKHLFSGGQTCAETRFIAPSVYQWEDLREFNHAALMADEVFGPVIPVCSYTDFDDAIEFIKSREQPLAAYYFGDLGRAEHFAAEVSSGSMTINDCIVQLSNDNLPFGGVGASGLGRYHGKYSFDTFTHEKSVLWRRTFFDPDMRYPPFTKRKQLLLRACTTPIWQSWFSWAQSKIPSYKMMFLLALLKIYLFLKLKNRMVLKKP